MGSKQRLLPWLHETFSKLDFDTALDGFSGSGCVAYLLKSMGVQVTTNDFLNFTTTLARALIENAETVVSEVELEGLLEDRADRDDFVERTFRGIFYTPEDLRFLDRVWSNLGALSSPYARDLALSALLRACVKRQPRGVFTVAGDPERYKDGRRDLRLSLEEHFREQVAVYRDSVFDNGRRNRALHGDVFSVPPVGFDLVYLDPPYVPRADDNCYVKRYHFLEGLSCYWQGVEILHQSKVRKLAKPYTPFSYRKGALEAFERLFDRFRRSTLVLSYSSNGYPELDALVAAMERVKARVEVHQRPHRYHFGTHGAVKRSAVQEYLIVGR